MVHQLGSLFQPGIQDVGDYFYTVFSRFETARSILYFKQSAKKSLDQKTLKFSTYQGNLSNTGLVSYLQLTCANLISHNKHFID